MIITAGIYKGRKIESPDEKITRPTLSKVRMGVFNNLYLIIGNVDGKAFLDVLGGSGIMGLEALSRGFGKVKVFEKNPKVAQILKKNYQTVGLKPNLTIGDSTKLVAKLDKVFDVVYIDPPYMSGIYEDILSKVQGGIIIAEHSEAIEFDGYEALKQKNYGGKMVSFLKRIA